MILIEPPGASPVDPQTLNAEHMRLTIHDALRHVKRALIEADAFGNQSVSDNLFIAQTRLETAMRNTKEKRS